MYVCDCMEISSEGVLVKYNGDAETVTVPAGITEIGAKAFSDCKQLRAVFLPDGLKSIGNSAFSNTALERIDCPDSIEKISDYAFFGSQLRFVKLPAGITAVNYAVFSSCKLLETVIIPDSVTYIGPKAFSHSGLKTVRIPDSVRNIEREAFAKSALTEITLPAHLTFLANDLFYDCRQLKKVTLPEGLIHIRKYAFLNCTQLENMNLPDSLIYLANSGKDCPAFNRIADALQKRYDETEIPVYSENKFSFQEFSFQYARVSYPDFSARKSTFMIGNAVLRISSFQKKLLSSIENRIELYRDITGGTVLSLYEDVPTFDSGDREYDSYKYFIVVPHDGFLTGIYLNGGYQLARVCVYEDIHFGDGRTKYILNALGIRDQSTENKIYRPPYSRSFSDRNIFPLY